MANIYPTLENADELLAEICEKELRGKYCDGDAATAEERLRNELEIVKKQGSASVYVIVYRALKAVDAKAEEFSTSGAFASTVLAYLLGFSTNDPISMVPKLYPEFYYGFHGEYKPSVEIFAWQTLCDKLWEYFRTYPDKDRTVPAHGTYGTGTGVYIGDTVHEDREEDLRKNNFYFGFHPSDATKAAKGADLFKGFPTKYFPESFENKVKLRGFRYGDDPQENVTFRLIGEGNVYTPTEEIISHREDLYELLMNKGMDAEKAFEITEYIRRGHVKRHGVTYEMSEALNQLDLPSWFNEFCISAPYLFSRAHTVELLTRKRDCE